MPNRIEAQKRLSMTYDQGKEMAAHQQLAEAIGVKVYFADPHSPWQNGKAIERGEIRRALSGAFTDQELIDYRPCLSVRRTLRLARLSLI